MCVYPARSGSTLGQDCVSNWICKALIMQQPLLMLCEIRLESVAEMKIRSCTRCHSFPFHKTVRSDGTRDFIRFI